MTITLGKHDECIDAAECADFSGPVYEKLSNGNYDYPVSVLEIADFEAYIAENRTMRRHAQAARNRGCTFDRLHRENHAVDIWEIGKSKPERQGRPLHSGYTDFQEFSPLPDYQCGRHRIDVWGVFYEGRCVAYTVLYVCGEVVNVSQIMGHGDYLRLDTMYLLMADAFAQLPTPIVVFYNRHDSGTSGLVEFKRRMGFQPERVQWLH